eukprot:955398-Rhodomonas_salina.1
MQDDAAEDRQDGTETEQPLGLAVRTHQLRRLMNRHAGVLSSSQSQLWLPPPAHSTRTRGREQEKRNTEAGAQQAGVLQAYCAIYVRYRPSVLCYQGVPAAVTHSAWLAVTCSLSRARCHVLAV